MPSTIATIVDLTLMQSMGIDKMKGSVRYLCNYFAEM